MSIEPRDVLANCIMSPSLYMGGPSVSMYRQADRYIKALEEAGFKIVRREDD